MKSEARLGELLGPKVVSRQWKKGRVCSHDDCMTILSRYNPSDYCAIHRPSKVLGRAVNEPSKDDAKPKKSKKK